MIYRETGQFKTSYAADQQIFPIRQDRIGLALILLVAFVVLPLTASGFVLSVVLVPLLIFALAAIGLVLLLFVAPVLFKFATIALLARVFGATPGNALRIALALAQAGEFGFVLLALAGGVRLVDPALMQPILAAMLLSMLSAPFMIHYSDKLVLRFVASEWMLRSLELHQISVSRPWRPFPTVSKSAAPRPTRRN